MTGTTAIIRETDNTSSAFSALVAERRHAYEFWTTRNPSSAFNDPLQSASHRATGITDAGPALAYIERFLRLVQRFRQVINDASGELFFDGMDSPLAEKIRRAIYADGELAVEALHQAILNHPDEVETGEEILRQIGLLRDTPTHQARLNLLTDMLELPQERIRDAASLGLSFMEDPAALPRLYDALQVEKVHWIKKSLSMAILQLERTTCPDT